VISAANPEPTCEELWIENYGEIEVDNEELSEEFSPALHFLTEMGTLKGVSLHFRLRREKTIERPPKRARIV
jgi:hypothetical protein